MGGRSKSVGLNILFEEESWSRWLTEFVQKIIPHASRWLYFYLHIEALDYPEFNDILNTYFGTLHLPMLESFDIHTVDAEASTADFNDNIGVFVP